MKIGAALRRSACREWTMEKFLLPAWGREHANFQPAVRERKSSKALP
jgi:hypothetical protein